MKIKFIVKDANNQPLENVKVILKYGIADTLLLTTKPFNRFNNVQGKLTVKYDAGQGNLAGTGGAVESFSVDFNPEDLVQSLNPYAAETFTVNVGIDLNFLKIAYRSGNNGAERFTVGANCTVDFINVGEINP